MSFSLRARYWRILFWINVVLAAIHAFQGNSMMFLSLGLALFSKIMVILLEHSTEN